ncbi:HlyU family transcriptional regulator [uncultured Enterovirga sp.]|uniref:HlyU family transcriptional regulator n=1 Tax=uncultured Enterovirga sp. TaxID=2026352 RepID=UPI0035CA2DF7
MSLWKRLFGGSPAAEPGPAKPAAEEEHKGFTILAEPYQAEGGQFQTAGTVRKEVDGTVKEHRFVRADRFATQDDATEFSLQKGRQLVDEQGERMFR